MGCVCADESEMRVRERGACGIDKNRGVRCTERKDTHSWKNFATKKYSCG